MKRLRIFLSALVFILINSLAFAALERVPNTTLQMPVAPPVFGYIAEHNGPRPTRAMAEVHAVRSDIVGWDDDAGEDNLYILLDQLQFDDKGRPFMHSRSFFLEGKFHFTVIRTH